MAAKELLVPFTQNGDMISMDGFYTSKTAVVDWRPNSVFRDVLRFQAVGYKGRFIFKNLMDKRVMMLSSEVERIIPLLVRGELSGEFTYRKQGCAYSIALVEEDAP